MNCSIPGCFVLYYLRDLLKFMFIESMILSNHLILYQPLLLLPSVFPSIRVFSNESTLHIRWPKYWSFSNSLPMNIQDRFPFTSVAQLYPTLSDHMNRSTPGLPVHHHLPEFTQTHVHQDSNAIQPSHLLSSPSPAAPNPSQHQSFPMSQLFA